MEQGQLLDDILSGRIDPGPEARAAEPLEMLCEAPRAVGNSLFKLIAVSVLVLPLHMDARNAVSRIISPVRQLAEESQGETRCQETP